MGGTDLGMGRIRPSLSTELPPSTCILCEGFPFRLSRTDVETEAWVRPGKVSVLTAPRWPGCALSPGRMEGGQSRGDSDLRQGL